MTRGAPAASELTRRTGDGGAYERECPFGNPARVEAPSARYPT